MLRAFIFAVKVGLLIFVAMYLANRPGTVRIDWLGYRLESHVGILLLAVLVLVIGGAFAYSLWRGMLRWPHEWEKARGEARRRKGYKALAQGMAAVAAGDADEAAQQARRANQLLEEPPLTLLLAAQTAQLNGDETAARRYFEAMCEQEETAFMGMRGLLMQAVRRGDYDVALPMAERALAARPRAPWAAQLLFDLQLRSRNWDAALITLNHIERLKIEKKPAIQHKRAVIIAEQARLAAHQLTTDWHLVYQFARDAHNKDKEFQPATLLFIESALKIDKHRQARRLAEEEWQRAPNGLLARLYMEIYDGSAADRSRHLQRLLDLKVHPEGQLLAAEEAILGGDIAAAERHLAQLGPLLTPPSRGYCRVQAQLAAAKVAIAGDTDTARQAENEVRHWLVQAVTAPPDPLWVCTACHQAAAEWQALCPYCAQFDSLAWRHPHAPQAEAPALPAMPALMLARRPHLAQLPAAPASQHSGPSQRSGMDRLHPESQAEDAHSDAEARHRQKVVGAKPEGTSLEADAKPTQPLVTPGPRPHAHDPMASQPAGTQPRKASPELPPESIPLKSAPAISTSPIDAARKVY